MPNCRVLITGATGFVGANLARRMVERGDEVHCLVRPSHRTWRLHDVADTLTLHVADLLDPAQLDAIFAATRPHWVLHLAAYGAYSSQTDPARCVRTNLEATIRLVDAAAAHGAERFVHGGTSSEYGVKDHPPDEDEATEPNSLYAVTKAAASAYVRLAGRTGKLHTTVLRLYSVYGPFEEPTRLIPTVIVRGLRGEYPPLVAPDSAHDFVYAGDAVRAFETALQADAPSGAVYNVGTGTQTTLRDVVALARARFGIAGEPQWGTMPARTWDTHTWVANTERIRAALGWQASTTFADGFRRTADWLSTEDRRSFYETARALPD